MSNIVLVPRSKIEDESIDQLKLAIQKIDSDFEIRTIEIKKTGLPSVLEIVAIYLAGKTGEVILKKIIEAGIDWGKGRIKERSDNPRPMLISIFGPEGVPLASNLIDENGEVEDKSTEQRREPLPFSIELL